MAKKSRKAKFAQVAKSCAKKVKRSGKWNRKEFNRCIAKEFKKG